MAEQGSAGDRLRRQREAAQKRPATGRAPAREQTRSSVYFDPDDWQALRRAAFDASVPINNLLVALARQFIAATADEQDAVVKIARQVTRERRGG